MRQGEIVQLGSHRLMCGDAFNPEHVDALMQGERADMLYCDPPYGMGFKPPGNRGPQWSDLTFRPCMARGEVKAVTHLPPIIGDEHPFDPQPLIARFSNCREQFWFGADYYRSCLPNGGSWIVWDKRREGSIDAMWGSQFELCWSRRSHRREIARVLWCGLLGMNGPDQGKRLHATQKPIRLAEWFLDRYSKPDALVVDLFAGSGSTLLACERMGRRCYAMEISPEYCGVVIDRYEALVGRARQLELGA